MNNTEEKYYKILELNYDLPIDCNSIKKAYRRLSMKYHPDKNNNTTSQIFNELNDAYKYLFNKHSLNGEINIPSNTNMQNNQKEENIDCYNLQNFCHDDTNNYQNSKFIDDICCIVNIDFVQAFNGCNIPITVNRNILMNSSFNISKTESETLYIKIPKGTDNNEIITLKNQGNIYNGLCSNIKVTINIIPNTEYTRDGLNLIYTLNISFKESLIGIHKIIKHLNNKHYKIISKQGEIINPLTIHTMPNLGFERDGFFGNLIIKFNINYPAKLSPEIIEKLKEIL